MPNPVAWFEIYVQDLQRARRFYESVLGITLGETTSPIEGTNMLFVTAGMGGGTGGDVRAQRCLRGGPWPEVGERSRLPTLPTRLLPTRQ